MSTLITIIQYMIVRYKAAIVGFLMQDSHYTI